MADREGERERGGEWTLDSAGEEGLQFLCWRVHRLGRRVSYGRGKTYERGRREEGKMDG